MAVSEKYFKYLNHFKTTVTMRELHEWRGRDNLIALRHDVDHDLDLSLEMSCWEHRHGIRATYFVLPDAEYRQDEYFFDKCLQIQDFGHEIGLHLNVISEWFKEQISDPGQRLKDILHDFRAAGVRVAGSAAHGDRLCYEKQFINYWIFEDLRPKEPHLSESGLSAEGIRTDDDNFRVQYPENHALVRDNGEALPLWSVSMRKHGLDYHALHVPHDHYFTDSGGSWKRSPDPLSRELTQGRHQVLIHPEYWRGPQKIYFFLSAARSGSRWLATVLDRATPLNAKHEFSLNHSYQGRDFVSEHLTGPGFTALDQDQAKARKLLLDIRTWIEEQGRDYGEANVYLERFLSQLQEVFPDAALVHLYRHPADVVRSIINRDWYDTPGDDRHPIIDVANWDRLSRFEKSCWYVRAANEHLMSLKSKICFEEMVIDPVDLEKLLHRLDIPFYPRLAGDVFFERINSGVVENFPGYAQWPGEPKKTFNAICAPVMKSLGYPPSGRIAGYLHNLKKKFLPFARHPFGRIFRSGQDGCFDDLLARPAPDNVPELIFQMDFTGSEALSGVSHKSGGLRRTQSGLEVIPAPDHHSYILLGGGEWSRLKEEAGWEPRPAHYYQGEIRARLSGPGDVRLFCLMYDQKGGLVETKLLQVIKQGREKYAFSFRVRSNTWRFNLALYMSRDDPPDKLALNFFRLQMCAWDLRGD